MISLLLESSYAQTWSAYKHDQHAHTQKKNQTLEDTWQDFGCDFVATPSPPEKPEKTVKEGEREEGESLTDAEKEKEKGREGKEGENPDSTESKEVSVWVHEEA